ncbi:hypothetical protein BDY24DRAFT_111944 [Mrakia frigida]|uniref:leucine-rich repeat domain-containing protein n=1 Tax=Mrakia frigida TaxID=29902 RepID=UPI003FCC1DEF
MPSQPSSSSSSSSSLTFTNGGAPQSLAALREASAAVDGVATPSKLGGAGRRELGRSTTVNPSLAAGGAGAKDAKGGKGSRGDLDLDLSSNKIGVLPRELFQLENLVYLSLRDNNLTRLPASISLLTGLKQLYIGSNQITSLPPSLLTMTHLEVTGLIPNPFTHRHSYPLPLLPTPSGSLLSPPIHNFPTPLTPLQELCFRSLLSPHPLHSNLPPFLNSSEILDRSALRSAKALQDAFQPSLHPHHQTNQHQLLVPEHLLSSERCLRILSCLRSFASTVLPPTSPKRLATTLLKDEEEGELEDAAGDPFYSPCPGRKHEGRKVLFLEAAEERMEWCSIPGAGPGDLYPVRWEGCGRGCLDFLGGWEEEEEGGEQGDGFDVEELGLGRAF